MKEFNNSYKLKYLKYKSKYLNLKKMIGGYQDYLNFIIEGWKTKEIDRLTKRMAMKKKKGMDVPDLTDILKPLEEINEGGILKGIIYLLKNRIDPSEPKKREWSVDHMISEYGGIPIYGGLSDNEIFRITDYISRANNSYSKQNQLPF